MTGSLLPTPPPIPHIAALIVTFNRAAKLRRSVDSVMAQTRPPDTIYVVDNHSTDSTGPYLDDLSRQHPQVKVVRLGHNTGGAGGFYHGIAEAYRGGADFIWVLDDDCYPQPDCLAGLLQGHHSACQKGHTPSFVCSRVLWTNGDICEMNNPVPTWNWAALYSTLTPIVLVESCSFVSVLLPRDTVARVGLPLKDYFIWHDDTEYTRRCTRLGAGIQNLESIAIHDLGTNRGVNFGDLNVDNAWKFEFGARNVSSYLVTHEGWVNTLRYFSHTRNTMRRARVPFFLRKRIYKKIIEGAFTFRPRVQGVDEADPAPRAL